MSGMSPAAATHSSGVPQGSSWANSSFTSAVASQLQIDPSKLQQAIDSGKQAGLHGRQFLDSVANSTGVDPQKLRQAILAARRHAHASQSAPPTPPSQVDPSVPGQNGSLMNVSA
jgi:hypothetical protein